MPTSMNETKPCLKTVLFLCAISASVPNVRSIKSFVKSYTHVFFQVDLFDMKINFTSIASQSRKKGRALYFHDRVSFGRTKSQYNSNTAIGPSQFFVVVSLF